MEQPNNQDNGDNRKAKRPDREGLDESTQSSSRVRTSLVSAFGGININQQRLSNHHLGSNLTHYHPSASTPEQMRTINYHRNISAVASTSINNVGSIFRPQSNQVQEYPSGSAGQQFRPNLDRRTSSASEVIMSSQPMFQPNIGSGALEELGFRLRGILQSRPNGSGTNGSGNSSGINNMSGINGSGNSSGINNMSGINGSGNSSGINNMSGINGSGNSSGINNMYGINSSGNSSGINNMRSHAESNGGHFSMGPWLLPEGIELKECSCKKTGCLNLYCACFKHGQYCCIDCKCQNCENTVENEHVVDHVRKKLLALNADAFSPKVVHNITEVVIDDEGVEHVKEVSILKNGCKCKTSNCEKAYCECNQKQLKCSNLCKCATCRNPKGKVGENNKGSHVNMSENGQRQRPRSLPLSQPTIQIGSSNNISTTNRENYGLVHPPLQANQPQQVGGNIPHTSPSQASNLTGSSNNNHNKGNTECGENNSGINSTVISTNGHANQTPNNEQLPGSAEMETASLQNSEVVSSGLAQGH